MTRISYRGILLALAAATALGVQTADLTGFSLTGYTWPTSQVVYYVNPQNKYVSGTAAIAAVRAAADVWSAQSRADVTLIYGGTTNGSTAELNYKNEVFFRDTSGGGRTHWWYNGSGDLVDADIILYEADRPLFTGNTGCSRGIYIEDLTAHEFGHALGLYHSADNTATMYKTTTYCNMNWRTLSADDISGIEKLYPPTSSAKPQAPSNLAVSTNASNPSSSLLLSWRDNASDESGYRIERSTDGASFAQIAQVDPNVVSYSSNGLSAATTYYYRVRAYNNAGSSSYSNVGSAATAVQEAVAVAPSSEPTVSIVSPLPDGTYAGTSGVTFIGSAADAQDGNLTADLKWRSSVDGPLGSGTGFTAMLSPGTHSIKARVRDSDGLVGSATVTITVVEGTAPGDTVSEGDITLRARGYIVRGKHRVDLTWDGAASSLDVYRNGAKVRKVANDGSYTDVVGESGSATYAYRVCETGTTVCSNTVSVSF